MTNLSSIPIAFERNISASGVALSFSKPVPSRFFKDSVVHEAY